MPPFAQVQDLMQSERLVKQLAFMDQQPGITLPALHRLNNLVERDDFILKVRIVDSERQKRAGKRSRYGDFEVGYIAGRRRLARYQNRPVVVSYRSAVGKQQVLIRDVGVGVETDGRDVVGFTKRFFFQRLDVFENVSEVKVSGIEFVSSQPIKHERVVRVRRMGYGDCAGFS